MAATQGSSGFGFQVEIETNTVGPVYTPIIELTRVSGPSTQLATADATHTDSPAAWMENIATLLSGGDVTLEGNLIPHDAELSDLYARQTTRAIQNFRVTTPIIGTSQQKRWAFAGHITNIDPNVPIDDKMGLALTIKPSGPVTHENAP